MVELDLQSHWFFVWKSFLLSQHLSGFSITMWHLFFCFYVFVAFFTIHLLAFTFLILNWVFSCAKNCHFHVFLSCTVYCFSCTTSTPGLLKLSNYKYSVLPDCWFISRLLCVSHYRSRSLSSRTCWRVLSLTVLSSPLSYLWSVYVHISTKKCFSFTQQQQQQQQI